MNVQEAEIILGHSGVVGIPTETVYGLGALIFGREGLEKIFSTKERPFFDPLIVHVPSIEHARLLSSNWTVVHEVLAYKTWPGPLTLITEKSDIVNPLITSGLNSVGVRCPDHPLVLELLNNLGKMGFIAAPSANKFGKTSPTTAQHVFDEFGESVPILDGGPCRVGIESTVAGVKERAGKWIVEIYRPGFYTAQKLKEILKQEGLEAEVIYAESPVAPGQLKHHYMPKIPLVIVPATFQWEKDQGRIEELMGFNVTRPAFWDQPEKSEIASRELYESMRKFDSGEFDIIITKKLAAHQSEDWMGIWNRLEKAKSGSLIKGR